MKLYRTYPIWLHLLHLIFHGALLLYQSITFNSAFDSSNDNSSNSEPIGPGWHFRYTTAWILGTLILYMFAAFLFDILLILRGINDLFIGKLKIHFDRFYCLMFALNHGMGLFYHILFFIECCPSYTETIWFIHMMPFWYSTIEFLLVPHNTKRDIKTTIFLPFIFCLIYFGNYWLYVAQTKGHYPYIKPWPAWRWLSYFCIPLTTIHLILIDFIREWLFRRRLLQSWHSYFYAIDRSGMQPIDWKALLTMIFVLLTLVAIWNISYLAVS